MRAMDAAAEVETAIANPKTHIATTSLLTAPSAPEPSRRGATNRSPRPRARRQAFYRPPHCGSTYVAELAQPSRSKWQRLGRIIRVQQDTQKLNPIDHSRSRS
jgi:hypothetical protein